MMSAVTVPVSMPRIVWIVQHHATVPCTPVRVLKGCTCCAQRVYMLCLDQLTASGVLLHQFAFQKLICPQNQLINIVLS